MPKKPDKLPEIPAHWFARPGHIFVSLRSGRLSRRKDIGTMHSGWNDEDFCNSVQVKLDQVAELRRKIACRQPDFTP